MLTDDYLSLQFIVDNLQRGFPGLNVGCHFFNSLGNTGQLKVMNLIKSVSIVALGNPVDAVLENVKWFAHKNAQQDSGRNKNHNQGYDQNQKNGVAQPGQVCVDGVQ